MEYASMISLNHQVSRNTTAISSHTGHGEHQPQTLGTISAKITSLSIRHHVA
jgi:hypothetical protein